MEILESATFWIGLVQCPLLYLLLNWASRGLDLLEVAPTKLVVGTIAGAAILALPLWAVGQIPMHGETAPRAWFFGFAFGVVPLGLIHWLRRISSPKEPATSSALGRCPYCGRSPGVWNILMKPPRNPFECINCGKRVEIDPIVAMVSLAVIVVPLAIYVVGWGAPEHIPLWSAWLIGGLILVPYPFVVKIQAAEE